MIVNQRQIVLLNSARLATFYKICFLDIVSTHGDLVLNTDKNLLQEIIQRQDERVQKDFKIREEKWRYRFMLLSLQYEQLLEYDYSEAILEILTWPDRSAEKKITQLTHHLTSIQ